MRRNLFPKLIHRYFSQNTLPNWGILVLDCLCILFASLLVYALNNGALHTLQHSGALTGTFCCYLLCYGVGFRWFRTYSGVIRFSSFIDLHRVGAAMLVGLAVLLGVKCFLPVDEWLMPVRAEDTLMAALIATLLMWVERVVVKFLYDWTIRRRQAAPVFIYGVRAGGNSLAKSIKGQADSPYVVKGFISDRKEMDGHYVQGVRVHYNDENLVNAMLARHAHTLLVSPLKSEVIRGRQEMVDQLIKAGIRIRMYGEAQEWDGKSELSYSQMKEVDIEDLLPRDKIEIDLKAVESLLKGKTILITGAAGSIGSEIVRQIAAFAPERLVLIDQAETPLHDVRLLMARQWPDIDALTIVSDICMRARMEEIFREARPDYVFHAAAYKHVPMMEDNPGEAIRNNVDGTRVIADLAVKYGARKFVMVSTDKAVNPTNVMGCSKRICEIYCQSLNKAVKEGRVEGRTQFVTTRFGNVLGSNGSVVPLFREQIKKGGPVTVTHPDIIRFFMLIPEACKLVLEAGTMGNGGEIYVFDMGDPVRIVDLAHRMIRLSGAKDIEVRFTGLRDGEKLYEEVLNEKENTKATHHPKIKIADVLEYDYVDVCRQVDGLVASSTTEDDMGMVRRMKAMVPEFKSQQSKYEVLDK